MTLESEQKLIDKLNLAPAEMLGHCEDCHNDNGHELQSIEIDGIFYLCSCNIRRAAKLAIRMSQQAS